MCVTTCNGRTKLWLNQIETSIKCFLLDLNTKYLTFPGQVYECNSYWSLRLCVQISKSRSVILIGRTEAVENILLTFFGITIDLEADTNK